LSDRQRGPREEDFVREVAKGLPPGTDAIVLHGYLGKAPTKGRWRLHASPDLNDYAEFEESAVVHTEPGPDADTDSLAGTFVWLRANAEVQFTTSRVAEARSAYQAALLTGDITERFLASSLDEVVLNLWPWWRRSRTVRSCKGHCCPDGYLARES
jgi:hypothetical protein